MKLFKSTPPSPEKAKEIVERFERRLAEAKAEHQTAQDAYAAAVVEAEELGTGSSIQGAEKARKTLERAVAAVGEAQVALGAGRQRQEQADAAAAQAATAAAWEATARAVDARALAVAETVKAIEVFAAAVGKLQQAGAAIGAAAPVKLVKDDNDPAVTATPRVVALVRLELVRAGMRWAADSIFASDTYDLIPLVDRVKEADAYVAKLRRDAGH